MKLDIKPEKYEDFKEYMSLMLTKETGKLYLPEDIFVECGKDALGFLKAVNIKQDDYKYIFGNVKFDNDCQLESLENLEYVNGFLLLEKSKIKELKSLQYIGGGAYFENSEIEDLGSLKIIEGDCLLSDTKNLKSLKNVEYIGGDLFIDESHVLDLGNLKYIGGDLFIDGSHVLDLGNLKYVGGRIFLNEAQKHYLSDKIFEDNGNYYFRNQEDYVYNNDYIEKE